MVDLIIPFGTLSPSFLETYTQSFTYQLFLVHTLFLDPFTVLCWFERLGGFSSLSAMAAFLLFLSCASMVAGVPSVSFPINSQVPPVARVSELFEFTFSPWTFASDVQPISITLVSGPSWLMFDNRTRNLYGMPAQEDVGSFTVILAAADATGSIDTEAAFVVSSEIGPVIGRGIETQLRGFGEVDGKGGLVFLPGQKYDFSFADDTFAPSGVVKRYEAVSMGHTPLPSWINFDGGRLKFSGTTPDLTSLIAPPQTWDITLIASDYPGFAGASVSFQMVVGPHRIFFEDTSFTTNATAGSQFSYTIPKKSILLDNAPIAAENLSSISTTASDWLSYDSTTSTLSGTPPQGADSTKVNIVARDVFGGEAQAELEISVLSPPTSIFTMEIPDFNVTAGEKFVYTLNRSSLSLNDVKLKVKYKPVTVDWITFDAGNLQLRGKAPNNTLSVEVLVSAQSPGKLSDSRSFNIFVTSSSKSPSTPTRSLSSTSTAAPTHTGSPKPQNSSGQLDMNAEAVSKRRRKRTLIIVLATVLPLCVVCSLLFVWYFVSRPRDPEFPSYYSRSATPVGSDISRPLEALPAPWMISSKAKDPDLPRRLSTFGYFTTNESGRISNGFMSSVMSGDGTILRLGTPPSPPTPLAKLPPAPENIEKGNSTLEPINFSKNPAIARPSYPSDLSSYSPHLGLVGSNYQGPTGHPAHQRTNSRGANSRVSHRLSDQSHIRRSSMSVKGVVNRRISGGIGHGRPTFGGPPGYGVPKRSWRRTTVTPGFWVGGRGLRESDATFETVSTEIFNQIAQIGQTNNVEHPSVRLVGDSPESGPEKARARGSSPFFAGSASTWRRGSKHAPPPQPGSKTPRQEDDQDRLMDDVIRAMSRENSHTKTIGTYSSLNLPETPIRRYNSALPSHFATSSSFGNYRAVSTTNEEEGGFKHVVDENGQRIWYPNHSRESGITAYSRGGSSYYPYEPFEYGVAVTSTRAQGPAAGRPSFEDERRAYILSKGGETVPPPRQRAKLVDFTKKRPVSISEEVGEDNQKNSSFPGDMTFL